MKQTQWTILLAGVMCMSTGPAAANYLILSLPEDGAWVRYYYTSEDDTGDKMSGKMILRSVGAVVENEKTCRWIEIAYREEGTGDSGVLKFLFPESELRKGGDPWSHLVRGWMKLDGKKTVEPIEGNWRQAWSSLASDFPPPLHDVNSIDEEKRVEFEQGQLKCPQGTQGIWTVAHRNSELVVFLNLIEYRVWPHADVPFGVAAATRKTTFIRDGEKTGEAIAELVLEDFGHGAKSDLPDSK
jgi:hypothetical protein